MTFGQTNEEAAKQDLTPDFFKSDADKAKDAVEGGVRDLTGNAQGRNYCGPAVGELKPENERTWGEAAHDTVDQARSVIQPNSTKSLERQTHDFATPENDSAGLGGIVAQAGEVVGDAVKGVKNAVVGPSDSETVHEDR